jgi:FkbM family methyltransferase
VIVEIADGIIVEIQGPLQQQKNWLEHMFYEQKMLQYIRNTYHGGTFIDGGACIGNHTLYFAKYCAEHVIAIEPLPRNMEHTKTNVELSKLDNVTFIQAALSDKPGTGAMEHAGDFHGQYNLVDGDDVEVITLDSLIDYPVSLIKLDIQRSEIPALIGGMELLKRWSPVLFIELVSKKELDKVSILLDSIGYKVANCFNSSPTYEFVRDK